MADARRRLQEKKLKPGEDVKEVDGKVQVSGQVAVMAINALLCAQKRVSDALLVTETAAALTPDNVEIRGWLKQLKDMENAK